MESALYSSVLGSTRRRQSRNQKMWRAESANYSQKFAEPSRRLVYLSSPQRLKSTGSALVDKYLRARRPLSTLGCGAGGDVVVCRLRSRSPIKITMIRSTVRESSKCRYLMNLGFYLVAMKTLRVMVTNYDTVRASDVNDTRHYTKTPPGYPRC